MQNEDFNISLFTKAWKNLKTESLCELICGLEVDGIELPVRQGFQVEPEEADKGLVKLADKLAIYDKKIFSVAAKPTERIFAGCAEAGIPIIRVMYKVDSENYMHSEKEIQKELLETVKLSEKYGVKIGIQNHCNFYVCNAMGIRHLIESYDSRYIGGVLDFGHNALCGEEPEIALDILADHLCMVNFKNAYWIRENDSKTIDVEWKPYWTTGRKGIASWPRAISALKKRAYKGTICMFAEYSDEDQVDKLIVEDLNFIKSCIRMND